VNLIRGFPHKHVNALCAAMFYGVMKCFLHNSEQAKRNLRWHATWHTLVLDFDLYALPLGYLSGQLSHGGDKTQIFQTGRMQIVRYSLDISCYVAQLLLQFLQALIHLTGRKPDKVLTRLLNSYR